MQKEIVLNLKKSLDDSYKIIISSDINIAKEVKELGLNNNFVIITDDIVYKLYKDKIISQFDKEKLNYKFIVFKNGEKSKNLKTFAKITEKMLALGFDRKSTVITLGGGVVGDMGGYIAGTFMRGIPFIQVPTTLLSQVDSSVGGKVAVDLKSGKNSSGLFYQPKKVIIDIDFLETLQTDEFNNGMYEIIKHGVIRDKKYFNFILKNCDEIKSNNKEVLAQMIYTSCLIKSDVVQKDERENNIRRILNFGHTIGHAIEVVNNFKIKHGFAIGLGMIIEAKIANKLKILDKNDLTKIIELINLFGVKSKKFNKKKLLDIIKYDKKNVKETNNLKLKIPIILPTKIGKVEIKDFTLTKLNKLL